MTETIRLVRDPVTGHWSVQGEAWKDAAGVTACPPADEAPRYRCTACGRKSWDEGERNKYCDMPQPGGKRCNGRLRAIGVDLPDGAKHE